ncbi:MAG: UDP-N-acetylglucosamine--N-acetylmuramyl-(pentapeptide) pyrophosphoryl-undecaprenol N-acetylglucosamine transferase [Anaerolineae bacterium]|nr:UDP-N-acetylglucosamine--N-acetylmuramyl-(pentapeptide) pyrophosphoryl-undecaprenol N-acetylglucosamine transferase [Anaerolineae bacterium]MCI0610609.1 UDP-N-acetylglucosamine--N-acetylmuramyl-(pentapeptide) pyrophosphoryl-undecaprenol N-acetylglucosamine transferase [Anaerolineae bacterium]
MYPALAVHSALAAKVPGMDALWVGSQSGMEESLVKRQGLSFRSVPAAGVHGVGLTTLPRNLTMLGRGVLAARRILNEFEPDVMFFTGGYVAVPVALAGPSIPTLLYVPDIEPGMALKSLARFADAIAVTTDQSQKYFRKTVHEVGYPLRADLALWDRQTANQHLGISGKAPVLLVFGGSLGAHSINLAVLNILYELLEKFEIIHLSGEQDWQLINRTREELPTEFASRYHALPYLHEMGAALAAADLVVSRAGASCLGEYPLFGLPAILVPYPHAWRYQKVNADYLTRRSAAIILEDHRLNDDLLVTLNVLMENPNKLKAMRAAMFELSHPRAAEKIASALIELAGD